MNRMRHELFSRPRLTIDQNSTIGRRDDRDLFAQSTHRHRLAHHRVLARERSSHVGIYQLQPLLPQCIANREHGLLDRERFFDEVKRAELRRAHRGLNVSVARDDHDSRIRSGGAELSQCLESIDAGKPNVEQDATVSALAERFQTLLTGGDGVSVEALVFHHRTQRVANAALVVNYENRIHLSCGQFNHKPGAARMIALRADVTTVLHYYALHDRESETSAAVTTREVRLKQPAEVCRFDSLPCVRYFSSHLFRIVTCHDRD